MSAPRRSPRVERGWTREDSPFHAGEQLVQGLLGVRDQVERAGRNMIHESMPDQLREFFEALPLLVVGSSNDQGQVFASLLSGESGFVRAPSPNMLIVRAEPALGDPLLEQLRIGAPLGLLGIQLQTRRRNRANGRIVARDGASFTLQVEQVFGNCPKYIQAREPSFDRALVGTAGAPRLERARLSERAAALLANTDTFFIATASAHAALGAAAEGVDVSHRGGRAGFVRVSEGPRGSTLTVPDFSGNFMFNTLGNLQVNPHAGIVCADFATGDVLSVTGSASVIWDGPELAHFEGAERLLEFQVESGVFLERAVPLRFAGFSASPWLEGTGTWVEAAQHATTR